MGIDPAPVWANLFLYFYENQFTTKIISNNKIKARHIEYCFFTARKITLKQDTGIPMGIDPAPVWANLSLYFYENQFMTKIISNNKIKARYFHSTK